MAYSLLMGPPQEPKKKIVEEAGEPGKTMIETLLTNRSPNRTDDLFEPIPEAPGPPAEPPSHPPDCLRAIDTMSRYLAGHLDELGRAWFVNHIRNCASCHDKLLALELTIYLSAEPS